MRWDGMRWDEMGWDRMRWDGMRLARSARDAVHGHASHAHQRHQRLRRYISDDQSLIWQARRRLQDSANLLCHQMHTRAAAVALLAVPTRGNWSRGDPAKGA